MGHHKRVTHIYPRIRRVTKLLTFAVPRGEFGRVEEVDPEDPTLILLSYAPDSISLRRRDNRMSV
jgi:hypothetical protein